MHKAKSVSLSLSVWFSAILLTACGQSKPSRYLLPEINSQGEVQLSEVSIKTLSNPRKVEGPAAVVYENPIYNDQGFHGKPAEPNLSESEDLWIPMDVKSSSALGIYYGFERIKEIEDRIIPEFSKNLKWPRQIAFDLQIMGGGMDNNAFYAGREDVTVIMPYTKNGLPISFNAAILAHEHFHAHFFKLGGKEVSEALGAHFESIEPHTHAKEAQSCNGLKGVLSIDPKQTDENVRQITNFFIVRGWNEGLADLYASLVTGNPNAFDPSLLLNGQRAVGETPYIIFNRQLIEDIVKSDLGIDDQGFPVDLSFSNRECFSLQMAYVMGTQVARTLYAQLVRVRNVGKAETNILSQADREWAIRQIFDRLSSMKEDLIVKSLNGKFEPNWISQQLLPSLSVAPQ